MSLYPPDYDKVPGTMLMQEGVRNYLEHGRIPGHFLTAIICNDLKEAVARADDFNQRLIVEWVKFFYNEVQSDAWGSLEKMKAWMLKFDSSGELK